MKEQQKDRQREIQSQRPEGQGEKADPNGDRPGKGRNRPSPRKNRERWSRGDSGRMKTKVIPEKGRATEKGTSQRETDGERRQTERQGWAEAGGLGGW